MKQKEKLSAIDVFPWAMRLFESARNEPAPCVDWSDEERAEARFVGILELMKSAMQEQMDEQVKEALTDACCRAVIPCTPDFTCIACKIKERLFA